MTTTRRDVNDNDDDEATLASTCQSGKGARMRADFLRVHVEPKDSHTHTHTPTLARARRGHTTRTIGRVLRPLRCSVSVSFRISKATVCATRDARSVAPKQKSTTRCSPATLCLCVDCLRLAVCVRVCFITVTVTVTASEA